MAWPDLLPATLPCSQIYCHGDLLHQVQMARLFKDDKHFVDMPLAAAPGEELGAPPSPEPAGEDGCQGRHQADRGL